MTERQHEGVNSLLRRKLFSHAEAHVRKINEANNGNIWLFVSFSLPGMTTGVGSKLRYLTIPNIYKRGTIKKIANTC